MFGVSLPELLLIMLIILLVFGPEKLPEAAQNLGRIFGSLKKSSEALRSEFYDAVYSRDAHDDLKGAGKIFKTVESEVRADLTDRLPDGQPDKTQPVEIPQSEEEYSD